MVLLIFSMSDFDGFINLHDILFGKFSLWSLMVIYDSFSYIRSIRSSIRSSKLGVLKGRNNSGRIKSLGFIKKKAS